MQTSLPHFPVKEMTVQRRYSDFAWLHDRLCVSFPGVLIPRSVPYPYSTSIISHMRLWVRLVVWMCVEHRFPEKKMVGNTDPQFVEERRRSLELYVVSLTHLLR